MGEGLLAGVGGSQSSRTCKFVPSVDDGFSVATSMALLQQNVPQPITPAYLSPEAICS